MLYREWQSCQHAILYRSAYFTLIFVFQNDLLIYFLIELQLAFHTTVSHIPVVAFSVNKVCYQKKTCRLVYTVNKVAYTFYNFLWYMEQDLQLPAVYGKYYLPVTIETRVKWRMYIYNTSGVYTYRMYSNFIIYPLQSFSI